MRKEYIIAGNWKMYKTPEESIEFLRELDLHLTSEPDQNSLEKIEVVVFPPFTSLYPLKDLGKIVKTGSQNIFHQEDGAYTGEISPRMLKGLVNYILIGHSERRHIFNEGDNEINLKIKAALKHDFFPILCIGETLEEREKNQTFQILKNQLEAGLKDLTTEDLARIAIAYEPVWAIGTGKTASPEQAQEVHAYTRDQLKSRTQDYMDIPILYGGSVKPNNCLDILSKKDINGVLVGGASLKIDAFSAIISHSINLVNQ